MKAECPTRRGLSISCPQVPLGALPPPPNIARVNIEIINTGSELMLGFVLNTHQQWICRQMANEGWVVDRQVAVSDAGPSIQNAVREGMAWADLVITTGGLGPTSDDLTRDLIAQLLNRPLREDAAALARIEEFFAGRKRPMPASTRIQAMVPEGATVLQNEHGTAPGLILEADPAWTPGVTRRVVIVMLPGPPRELRPMFTKQVIPWLKQRFPPEAPFLCRVLKTTGVGESVVEETIAPSLQALALRGLEIGYCARVGEVDVRLTARGVNAGAVVEEAETVVRRAMEKSIFGQGEEQLEQVIVRELAARQQTLALAESCTGGFIAHRVTNVPGASAVLLAGLVTYSNETKQQFLGVLPETLAAHGAVSEAVAREMAEGALARTGARYALSVTGIAGPSGGSEAKPVGTVFLGLAEQGRKTIVLQRLNQWDRETFKFVTSQQALDMLRRSLE